MLPFQTRNVRDHHSDQELRTDDVEVVKHVRNAALVAPSSKRLGTTLRSTGVSSQRSAGPASRTKARNERPQVAAAPVPASRRAPIQASVEVFSEPDDEMTCLMPSKLILPPASKRANELRPMAFQPQTQPQRLSPSTPQPMRTLSARQESMHDTNDSYTFARVPAPPASLAPMAMPSVDSDPRINPGATVLTSRSLAGRPTVSWAAALVVMGIFAGLVTAAVARGDLSGDASVAAASQPTVQQVIPSAAQAQLAAASQPAASPMGAFYNSGASAPMALSAPVSAAAVAQPVAVEQPVAAAPVAAKFAPAPQHVASAPRAVTPASAPAAPVAHIAKSEVKEKKEVVASKSKKDAKGDDMASAKEAQALADAQLAASL